jgi:hypothetical protein
VIINAGPTASCFALGSNFGKGVTPTVAADGHGNVRLVRTMPLSYFGYLQSPFQSQTISFRQIKRLLSVLIEETSHDETNFLAITILSTRSIERVRLPKAFIALARISWNCHMVDSSRTDVHSSELSTKLHDDGESLEVEISSKMTEIAVAVNHSQA